ncbi:MAG: zinc-dependent dehydrogenase [Candidatus Omnitrophota bacterium]|nr:zinc-dependent dehydrogenase [Candidatus Omnitrophota bacterium]MBU1928666.1 zinc-dependent dehydrogenase [Candidatus Omnitrophota bacterium]MBU2035769.1 zinc-dependent dehydrogenase [Candidatus Omnitrophota bacterium]MBU2222227.1 zinc-dependent dehydrogenase [Candidatus Omnitrophota bacterium]MBU2258196.1 zinc-dependent dehydrogenase [Candidatus Omnitrophota bacterium]
MRVVMYYNNRDVRIEEMPKPKIGPGEILVKVNASGICGSDVMEWYRIKKAPLVLGHEIAGEIAEVGKDVPRYKVGDRVFVSHHVPCNTCRYCLSGQHTACETLHTTNYFPGGFSEYIRVPALNVDRGVFLLPPELSFEEATFIEPLACVLRGQILAGLQPGQTVLILGSGVSGLLHLLTAQALGAGRIITTDIQEYRMKKAKELGADLVINAKEDIPKSVLAVNENRLADLVIICAGSLSVFKQALQSVDRGGTVLCFAPTEPGIDLPLPVNDFWRKGIKIMPSYGNSPADAVMAIDLLRSGRITVARLITHRLSLEEAALGFRLVSEGKDCIKVILSNLA